MSRPAPATMSICDPSPTCSCPSLVTVMPVASVAIKVPVIVRLPPDSISRLLDVLTVASTALMAPLFAIVSLPPVMFNAPFCATVSGLSSTMLMVLPTSSKPLLRVRLPVVSVSPLKAYPSPSRAEPALTATRISDALAPT